MTQYILNFLVSVSLFTVCVAQDLAEQPLQGSSSSKSPNLILEDIHSSKEPFSFDTQSKEKIKANYSIRRLCIDHTEKKLTDVSYFLAPNARISYDFQTQSSYGLTYGPVEGNTLPLTIKLPANFTRGIRTSGKIQKNKENCGETLQVLDTVNPTYTFLRPRVQQNNPASIEALITYFNKEKSRKEKGTAELESKAYYYKTQEKEWASYSESVFKRSNPQKGDIGESVLDLLMLNFGWTRLNGKCGSNNGIDGLYENGDMIIAAEVKFYKKPITIENINADYLRSKFDATADRAITKVSQPIRSKILTAYQAKKFYLLPFSFQVDGRFYSKLSLAEDLALSNLIAKPLKELTPSPFFPNELIGKLQTSSSLEEKTQLNFDILKNLQKAYGLNTEEFTTMLQTNLLRLKERDNNNQNNDQLNEKISSNATCSSSTDTAILPTSNSQVDIFKKKV